MSSSPFKFLDSYTRADIGSYFGREKETDELFRRCFLSNILIVYGGSGTGKTSLVQCGLASRFQESDWLPVHVRRSGDMLSSLTEAVREHTLTPKSTGDLAELVTNLYLDHFKPIWFLFDQFEELFIFGTHSEAEDFFTAIARLVEGERNARCIFIVREEYLAELTRYERIIPGLIENRNRVERLSHHHAMNVVQQLCGAHGITCTEGFASALVERLDPESHGIELSYLQVFLDRCWRTRQGDEPFSPALLERIGHVDDLLGAFLDEQVADTSEPQRAEALLKTFVSDQGTKRQLTSAEAHEWVNTIGTTMDLADVERLLQVFVTKRLLKERDERGRYELLHDALARQIFQRITRAEQELIEVRQFVQQAHGQFLKRGVKLTANDLTYLRPYRNQLHLKGEVRGFVEGAFGEEERKARDRRSKRRWLTFGALGFGILASWYTVGKVKELNRVQRKNYSLELAQRSDDLLGTDPIKGLAFARQAFLEDSNATTVKALAGAYDLGYNELARYEGNMLIWPISMQYFAVGNEQDHTVKFFDSAFEQVASIDSMVVNGNLKAIADSLVVCQATNRKMRLMTPRGDVIREIPFRSLARISDLRHSHEGSPYFTLTADSAIFILSDAGSTIAKIDLSDTSFSTSSGVRELHLWDTRHVFELGESSVTFYQFDDQGKIIRREALPIPNVFGPDPMRSVKTVSSVDYLAWDGEFRFYDDEGLFEIVQSDTGFVFKTLLQVPGTARNVELAWIKEVQRPFFGFNDQLGRSRVRFMTDSMRVYEWESNTVKNADLGVLSASFGSGVPKGELYCTVRPDPVSAWTPRLSRALVFPGEDLLEYRGFTMDGVEYGRLVGMEGSTGYEITATKDFPVGFRTVRVFQKKSYSANSSEIIFSKHDHTGSFSGSIGKDGLKLLGGACSVLSMIDVERDDPRLLILDSVLQIKETLPGLSNTVVAKARVSSMPDGDGIDAYFLSRPGGIDRLGLSKALVGGITSFPEKRRMERNLLAVTGWYREWMDNLTIYPSRGRVFCKVKSVLGAGGMRAAIRGVKLYELQEDSFRLKQSCDFHSDVLNPREIDLVFGLGEQACFQYRHGSDSYWLIDGTNQVRIELPRSEAAMTEACLAPDGSVLYANSSSGIGIWDSTGIVSFPESYSLKEISALALNASFLDTLNEQGSYLKVARTRLNAHRRSHRQGEEGGRCLFGEGFGSILSEGGRRDSAIWILTDTMSVFSVGAEVRDVRTLLVQRKDGVDNQDVYWNTVNVSDTRYNEVIPTAENCALLRRSSLTEDGFAIVVGNTIALEKQGYAAPIGNGMVLTNHRTRREFERYPVTPTAVLYMLDVEKVYGNTLVDLGPKSLSNTYRVGYAIGSLMRSIWVKLGLLLGVAALGFFWWRRRKRLRAV